MFTSEALEAFADELAPLLPLDDPRVYPVSGGSEAVETALKLARRTTWPAATDRHKVVARWGSYHGNSRGALDASGREPLRGAVRAVARPVPHVRPRTSTGARPGPPERVRGLARRAARRLIRRGARTAWPASSPSRWPAPAGRGGPHRRLLAGGGRGVPAHGVLLSPTR